MNPKVIIVDDDDINNFLCKRIITLAHFSDNISTFLDANSALSFLRSNIDHPENLPDIIFLDINMPIKNGWDFLAEYESFKSSIGKNIHIYMLSSSVYEEDMKKAKNFDSIVDYIPKPLSESVLEKIKL